MTIPLALAVGFVLDMLFGDPLWLPHPVVAIGRLIAWLEKTLRPLFPKTEKGEETAGFVLVAIVAAVSLCVPLIVLAAAYQLDYWLGVALECFVCYQALATKCLAEAGDLVARELNKGDLPAARAAVARIVGRDTDRLDESGVVRAAVETVAENSSDGVVAPMLYFAVGGAPLALAYKAVNTMDSMLGYKNEKYLHFGRAAARLDDAANFVPARLTALLMVAASALAGFDWRGALRIWRRDGAKHSSPNAGQPESACAGSLGVWLGGDSSYGGVVVRKPVIGDAGRDATAGDIDGACRLLYWTGALCAVVCIVGVLLGASAWN